MPNRTKNKTVPHNVKTGMTGGLTQPIFNPKGLAHDILHDSLLDKIMLSTAIGGLMTNLYINSGGFTALGIGDMLSTIVGAGALTGISTVVAEKVRTMSPYQGDPSNEYIIKFLTAGVINLILHIGVYSDSALNISAQDMLAHTVIGGVSSVAANHLMKNF